MLVAPLRDLQSTGVVTTVHDPHSRYSSSLILIAAAAVSLVGSLNVDSNINYYPP